MVPAIAGESPLGWGVEEDCFVAARGGTDVPGALTFGHVAPFFFVLKEFSRNNSVKQ